MKILLLFLYLLSAVILIHAGEFTFDTSLRERVEMLDGFNKKAYGESSIDAKGNIVGKHDDTLLLQRFTFGLHYITNAVDCDIVLYDARSWGSSIPFSAFEVNRGTPYAFVMNSYNEYAELSEAAVTFKHLWSDHLSLKVGRQDIVYGDKRIIGPGEWGNSIGWLWDAARFSYKLDGNFVDGWYGQTRTKDPEKFSLINKHLYEGAVLYSHFKTTEQGAIEPFYVYKHNRIPLIKSDTKVFEYLNYTGVRFYEKDYHGFNFDATYSREFGTYNGKNVDAYGYTVKAGYRFKDLALKPNIVIGRIYASGDNNPVDDTFGRYSTPFGSTDGSHYGRMDIMSWSNMEDNQVNLFLYPSDNMSLKLSYHDFNLANANDKWAYFGYKNKNGYLDTKLGDEYDTQLYWHLTKNIKLSLIYGYFKAGSFVKHNVEDNDAQHLFLQFEYRIKNISIYLDILD